VGFTPVSTLSAKQPETQEELDQLRRERGDADLERALRFLRRRTQANNLESFVQRALGNRKTKFDV
jgi:hypothetical protein